MHLIFSEDAKKDQADPSKAKKKPEPEPVKGSKPKFSKLLTHDVAEDGRSVRFDCKITADPEPDVQWYDCILHVQIILEMFSKKQRLFDKYPMLPHLILQNVSLLGRIKNVNKLKSVILKLQYILEVIFSIYLLKLASINLASLTTFGALILVIFTMIIALFAKKLWHASYFARKSVNLPSDVCYWVSCLYFTGHITTDH